MKALAFLFIPPLCALAADAPLQKPLAEFDRMVSKLQSGAVVGEPIQAGQATIVPFAAVQFGLGSAGILTGFGGGMAGKVVPLGVVVIEGDEVRVEQIPQSAERPSLMHELVKAILERKVVFMGNGLNLGNIPGTAKDLAPLVSGMMGDTTIVGNAVNLGSVKSPNKAEQSPAPPKKPVVKQ